MRESAVGRVGGAPLVGRETTPDAHQRREGALDYRPVDALLLRAASYRTGSVLRAQ